MITLKEGYFTQMVGSKTIHQSQICYCLFRYFHFSDLSALPTYNTRKTSIVLSHGNKDSVMFLVIVFAVVGQGGTDSCHSSIRLTVSVHIDRGGCRLAGTHTPTYTSGPF